MRFQITFIKYGWGAECSARRFVCLFSAYTFDSILICIATEITNFMRLLFFELSFRIAINIEKMLSTN